MKQRPRPLGTLCRVFARPNERDRSAMARRTFQARSQKRLSSLSMRGSSLLVAQAHRYVSHNALGHGASNTTWTAVLAGLIPILGIAALGIMVYAFVRKGSETPDD
jgi:hypothetical protein